MRALLCGPAVVWLSHRLGEGVVAGVEVVREGAVNDAPCPKGNVKHFTVNIY